MSGDVNLLADVAVPDVDKDFPDMYMLQIELQRRLNQLPMDTSDHRHMAHKSIYWGHCIRAEVEELVEWLSVQTDPTWLKEMQMESIDIVHFVFNLGIEAGFTDVDIFDITAAYEHSDWPVQSDRINAAVAILNKSVINHVNLLHWKTWKTYNTPPDAEAVYDSFTNIVRANLMLCNACGLSANGIVNMYFAKNKVNHQRQDNGY